jgi:hypothetical protein
MSGKRLYRFVSEEAYCEGGSVLQAVQCPSSCHLFFLTQLQVLQDTKNEFFRQIGSEFQKRALEDLQNRCESDDLL